MREHYEHTDSRPLYQRLSDARVVWTYVVGLAVMLIAWAFLAYAAIGNTTMDYPYYNLPNPTPAAQAYNTIGAYQELQR